MLHQGGLDDEKLWQMDVIGFKHRHTRFIICNTQNNMRPVPPCNGGVVD